jgi:hypothetical protein
VHSPGMWTVGGHLNQTACSINDDDYVYACACDVGYSGRECSLQLVICDGAFFSFARDQLDDLNNEQKGVCYNGVLRTRSV